MIQATARWRYGGTTDINEPDALEDVIDRLIHQLRTEEFEEPDDEHTRVSLSCGDFAIEIQVSGRVSFVDLSCYTTLYLRDVPDHILRQLLVDLAHARFEQVQSAGWLARDALPPYERDFYRQQIVDVNV